MQTFTPGPWAINRSVFSTTEKSELHIGNPRLTCAVVYVDNMSDTKSQQESNARLIASAPDLLRALEDAEFLLRKVSNNPKEIGSMLDSLKRCAIDAREAIQSVS